jgi:hypothetical protein
MRVIDAKTWIIEMPGITPWAAAIEMTALHCFRYAF